MANVGCAMLRDGAGCQRCGVLPDGKNAVGATRPAGVTEEHLLGPKTTGFRGSLPSFP